MHETIQLRIAMLTPVMADLGVRAYQTLQPLGR